MTFVDASALVAILTGEPDAADLAVRLQACERPFITPIGIYEATLALARKVPGSVELSRQDVMDLLVRAGVQVLPVTATAADLALSAFARYGKGQGHPAQLNMGDCFAYAAARQHGAALLCKGGDFPQTDIRLA